MYPGETSRHGRFTDRFEVLGYHHVELWCADAASAASRFSSALGVPLAARSDPSTGNSAHSSHLLHSGSLSLLFTAPPHPAEAINICSSATLPSFSPDDARRFTADHGGPALRAIALRVADAAEAFRASVDGGARPAFGPADLGLGFGFAEVELYGDVILRFVSCPHKDHDTFLPGFVVNSRAAPDYGLMRFDHIVSCVPELAPVATYVAGFTGFHRFVEYKPEELGTADSSLHIAFLANNAETVLLNFADPVHGTRRRSQVETFMDRHGGAGVQHIALASNDVLATLRNIKDSAGSGGGGFEFLEPPPPSYYEDVRRRAGDVLSEAQIEECQDLGVLVDRDEEGDQGVILQIFTKPVGDRDTLLLEMIQRIGCMHTDPETGREYQRGACGGFGKANFRDLFKSVEDYYEKSLEAAILPATAE